MGKKSQGKLENILNRMIMKTQHKKLWAATKAIIKEKIITVNVYIRE